MCREGKDLSSFRDNNGFVFYRDGVPFRQINISYKENYDFLLNSGLYKALVEEGFLIAHNEEPCEQLDNGVYKIIKPEQISFVSYPYEWMFSQLKDAALLTLNIQKKALDFGMSLKDASAYNIQFKNTKPVFIDTLSFEKYENNSPWVGYRQFCQHFLGPLALMSYTDARLGSLLKTHIDGIPLDLTSTLLARRSFFIPSLLVHIHLHAASQKYFQGKQVNMNKHSMSRWSLLGLIDHLESAILRLKYKPTKSEWVDYYDEPGRSKDVFDHKSQVVGDLLEGIKPKNIWDFGSNRGLFVQKASARGTAVVCIDSDPVIVEKNYLEYRNGKSGDILPLWMDLTCPSPRLGWALEERKSLMDRGPVDMVLALALIHHWGVVHNIPLSNIADFLSKICKYLIIEFIPPNDSHFQKILGNQEHATPLYSKDIFEKEFGKFFAIEAVTPLKGCDRVIYLMHKRK